MVERSNDFDKGRLTERVNQHEERLNKIDEVLEKVRNRLPIWASILIACLVGLIGWLAN